MKLILTKPVITEKSSKLQEVAGQHTFLVYKTANKIEIKRSVESKFGVKVKNINTMNCLGGTKRVGKYVGKKSDYKKAIVTLEKGQKLELFDQA